MESIRIDNIQFVKIVNIEETTLSARQYSFQVSHQISFISVSCELPIILMPIILRLHFVSPS